MKNTALTEKEYRGIKVLRNLTKAECDDIANLCESEISSPSFGETHKNDCRIGQKVYRPLLYDWGNHLERLQRPVNAMQAAAESDKLDASISQMLGTPRVQNELTTTAMMMGIDVACVPTAEVVEGNPDTSDLM